MQNHCSADLWKESNSVSAVISVLWWVCGHIGCLHIWCDNEVVVSHFKELQQGLATPECFEHADLWRQVQVLLREATVELLINKVYSHVESASQSPRIFAEFGTERITKRNLPTFSEGLEGFDYRDFWQQRIKLRTSFVIEIAAFDCEQPGRNEADDGPELALIPVFTHLPDNTFVASSLEDIKDRADIFTEVHSPFFSAVFHQVVAWLISPSCMIYKYNIYIYIYLILYYVMLYFMISYYIILYYIYITYYILYIIYYIYYILYYVNRRLSPRLCANVWS